MQRKARAGHVTGGRVFGYDNVAVLGPGGKRSHVERQISEAEATVVRQIFSLSADGRGQTAISKHLNSEGALSPRSQQGRPKGWSSSSVREVLHRPLYAGEIVWNRTQKRDRWGQSRRRDRVQAEYVRVEAPALRIVPQELWDRAGHQMRANRERAAGGKNPKHPGRPPGSGGKYLLTGLLTCGVCGAGLEAMSRHQSNGRRYFYGCSAYRNKGRAVCGNSLLAPMEDANRGVLSALQNQLLSPAVIEAAWNRLAAHLDGNGEDARLPRLRRELAELRRELENLGGAIAALGNSDTLVGQIRKREADARSVHQAIESIEAAAAADTPTSEVIDGIRAAFADWRGMIERHASEARLLVRRLIQGRLAFMPKTDAFGRRYEFSGVGTVEPVLAGILPSNLASPTESDRVWRVNGDTRDRAA
jgi:hypothetical protein